MSGDLTRFVSILAPDIIEIGTKAYLNHKEGGHAAAAAPKFGAFPRMRKPRLNAAPPTIPPLGKKEPSVSTTTTQTPAEIQAGLDASLNAFVNAAPTELKKADMLIKIATYRAELARAEEELRKAAPEAVREAMEVWFARGDAPLKKALFNMTDGSEAFPLAKIAANDEAEQVLVKMIDGAAEGTQRTQMVQHIGTYTNQVHTMLNKVEAMAMPEADRDAVLAKWMDGSDGSHRDLKKAVLDYELALRKTRSTDKSMVGHEKDVVDERAGNASSHVGSKFGFRDSAAMARVTTASTREGAGSRLSGTRTPPGGDDRTPNPGSGPTDVGAEGIHPAIIIRRKGTTGGLGTVEPTEEGAPDGQQSGEANGKRKKKKELGKSFLAAEMIEIAPDSFIEALDPLPVNDQLEAVSKLAQHGADLMAWTTKAPDTLAKSVLDHHITQWLAADPDPDAVALKKWAAEALASAEEIPLALGRAIMAWTPAGPSQSHAA